MRLIIILCFLQQIALGQDQTDAERLSQLSYMQYADGINCDSTSGSNLEHRICLNLEFQKVDSILNNRFSVFLQTLENDSLKFEIESFQKQWIKERQLQSKIKSEGWRAHMFGIIYLDCMVNLTKRRIEEIEFLSGED